jgi:hypothetical protein
MNRENMTKLALFLEDLPSERFDIGFWVSDVVEQIESEHLDLNNCGTAGCIAGWALALKNNGVLNIVDCWVDDDALDDNEVRIEDVRKAASNWLGINIATADRLFYTDSHSYWSQYADDYQLEVNNGGYVEEVHPKHAADMLYRILSGEIEEEKDYYSW